MNQISVQADLLLPGANRLSAGQAAGAEGLGGLERAPQP